MSHLKRRYLFPGIAVGILILIVAIIFKPTPKESASYNKATAVELITLTEQELAPEIKGFGRVAPKHIWQAVAEVSGKIVYRHPQLETGRMLPKGTRLLAIDPLEYELQLAQADANLNATQATLTQLDQQEKNLKTSLNIEQQKLRLSTQEFERKQTLNKQNLVSKSDLESQKLTLLAQTKLVEDLQNSLKLLPDDRKVTQAQLRVDIAKQQDGQRRLEKTQVILPFDARIAEVNIEKDQVVTNGAVMLAALELGAIEVKAEVALQDMRILANSLKHMPQQQQLPSIELLGLEAQIGFQAGDEHFIWPAKVTRVAETVNPNNATIGIYLEVEQDFRQIDMLKRPPLTKGMFVQALIKGRADRHLVVPEKVIHENQLYQMTAEKKLQKHPIQVLFRNQHQVAISGELVAGSQIVVNDIIPAMNGMLLRDINIEETTRPNSQQGELQEAQQ